MNLFLVIYIILNNIPPVIFFAIQNIDKLFHLHVMVSLFHVLLIQNYQFFILNKTKQINQRKYILSSNMKYPSLLGYPSIVNNLSSTFFGRSGILLLDPCITPPFGIYKLNMLGYTNQDSE